MASAPAHPLRVLHLVGSPVSELYADLSRLYAADCLTSTADPARYEPVVALVSPDGSWRFPLGLDDEAVAEAVPVGLTAALSTIVRLGIDVALPQMFCPPGMTTYRGMLEVLGIPYVGNRPDVMAVAADKALARAVVAAGGVAVPEGEVLVGDERPSLAPPVVVKPVDADNSLGVSLVRDGSEYDAALVSAREHADRVLVERYVELGREVRCGVLDCDGELVCLPLEEYTVDTDRKPIRGVDDKLRRDERGLGLVAKDASYAHVVDVADPVTEAVWEAARLAHRALGCRHHSLFDFRIDPEGRPWFLEAGLYCSFARQSVVAAMARAAGIPLERLLADSVSEALR